MFYFIKRFFFSLIFATIYTYAITKIFSPILLSDTVIIPFAINPFNICLKYPVFWSNFKLLFSIIHFISGLVLGNLLFFFYIIFTSSIKKKSKSNNLISNKDQLALFIGYNINTKDSVFLTEKSLYQNLLITGTIGTGKTSSAMYPFTKQLIFYESSNKNKKLGMLILDVKGNFHKQVLKYVEDCNRVQDLIIIELGTNLKYNPLDKPNLKPSVLANRLKTILLLFSNNNSDDYWLDKVEQLLTEAIKFCRIYNDNYVTFKELHNLIISKEYFYEKVAFVRNLFLTNTLSLESEYNLLSIINFFEKEFFDLDLRTSSIIKSEVTRITNLFISDYQIQNTFSPKKSEINFTGFKNVLEEGKIVVLNMNISEYKNLSKIIAAYLKLDFQTEVLLRLKFPSETYRPVVFISDEFHEYITSTDADFFAQSREAKCINIVATQSYTSILNTLNNTNSAKVIIQNLVNKLWFRTDDIFTIEDIQKQIGKEEKEKISKNISENAKETKFNYFLNSFNSRNSSLSEGYTKYSQLDYVYDTNFFTQNLETFSCLSFLSDGNKILVPSKLKLVPYFEEKGVASHKKI